MLIVALDASRKEPLYEQIYNSIKEEIVTGALPFGARLPSARRLYRVKAKKGIFCLSG